MCNLLFQCKRQREKYKNTDIAGGFYEILAPIQFWGSDASYMKIISSANVIIAFIAYWEMNKGCYEVLIDNGKPTIYRLCYGKEPYLSFLTRLTVIINNESDPVIVESTIGELLSCLTKLMPYLLFSNVKRYPLRQTKLLERQGYIVPRCPSMVQTDKS